ncbi:flagellar basal-body rod protein FlgB [Humitalea rosea]|uniref:Flagellar basal-body rod protein FlgB n=1 Tax=Humitalea rosea TaxID=990373 RepID=A0A2W7IPI2_9PROT|nr:flagellar basal body protein [Humitalea rosea]PZW41307.1 flagellar basal-body rod protein FlgB [Humitalea rosea]
MQTASPAADPIALAESRLRWLDRRQTVLAQNIANADTPNYVPRDIAPFAAALARSGVEPVRTNARHLGPTRGANGARPDRSAEREPNGNAVSLDQQALLVAETDQAHALAFTLHHRMMGLFRIALGRQG